MNAPTDAAHLAQPQVELIPLDVISFSPTAGQEKRRAGYDHAALADLAASINDGGLLFPILVRPFAALRGETAKYELVAGERRYLATQLLGHAHIAARILALTDVQVLKAQAVENLQREALDTMAEALGYKDLVAGGVPAEAIGDMIGKSRSYVYARLQLTTLAPGVQKALADGELSASQALLFARVPSEKLQEAALATLRKWDYQGRGEQLSFRHTARIFQDKGKGLFIPLNQVPFRQDDATFHTFGPKQGKHPAQDMIPLPACTDCPKRSGNDRELLAALEDPDVCTDKACHDVKAKQALERRRTEIEKSGVEVLRGDDAAAILPTDYGTRGYIDLDAPCDADEFPEEEPTRGKDESDEAFDRRATAWDERADNYQPRTYRQILGNDVAKLELKIVEDGKKGRFRELAPDKAVMKLLKEKGITERIHRDTRKPAAPEKPKDPEAAKRTAEREARERAAIELKQKIDAQVEERTLKAVRDKWKGPLDRDELELIAVHLREEYGYPDLLEVIYPGSPKFGAMKLQDLGRYLVMHVVAANLDGYRGNDKPLKALCKRLKVDTAKIEKEVRNELAPKEAGATKKPARK